MSEVVRAVTHWNAEYRDLIVNLDEVGRMLTLDALTLNEDRHARNILMQPQSDDAHFVLWAIDSGDALIGSPTDFVMAGLKHPDPRNHARGLPIEALRSGALASAQQACALPERRLHAIVAEACGLAREPEQAALTDALIHRCGHAPQIVASYLDALGWRS